MVKLSVEVPRPGLPFPPQVRLTAPQAGAALAGTPVPVTKGHSWYQGALRVSSLPPILHQPLRLVRAIPTLLFPSMLRTLLLQEAFLGQPHVHSLCAQFCGTR